MEKEKIIEIFDLSKRYKKFWAVDNVNLSVYKGDVFGFLGPNGAGKSTTIRMLLSLITPTRGEIKIFNKHLKQNRTEILKNVGAIVEKPDFYMYLSARKNLEILSRISGKVVSAKKINETLELVGLLERGNSKVKTFSHGMKQRLGLAQALMHDPELIVLDEPTTGLDPQGMKEIRDLIIHLSSNLGKTIFLSSHLLSEIEIICNRMIIINKGKVKVEGEVKDILNYDGMNVTIKLKEIEKAREIIERSDWKSSLENFSGGEFIFKVSSEKIADLNKFFVENSISVFSIVPQKSLEDYFLSITREAEK